MTIHTAHLLIVDDDTRIRDLLGKFLKDNGFFVTTAKDALEAEEKLQEFIFDLLVVDVMMPGKSGVEFTTDLRMHSDIPVLMLTAMGEAPDRIKGLESGADDYLQKPFEPRELLLRIQKILMRTKPAYKEKTIFGNMAFEPATSSLSKNGQPLAITENEAKILKALCNNIGNVIPREDMAKLCGGVNERTIDVLVTRLRSKIEENPKNPVYLKTVRGMGYILHN